MFRESILRRLQIEIPTFYLYRALANEGNESPEKEDRASYGINR